MDKESVKALAQLRKLQEIKLTIPLSEKTRPNSLDDIVGQEQGIRALRAALCCPNPQHILIYGPPGIGKTAAARVVLEEAKHTECSPFKNDAKYIEIDATTLRFDERGIADPLIGSVHDPIYQGAGAYGQSGIPQPKPGAVTKAHGGVLFIDEIGELHPIQMNKLLKVLEDRRVFMESAYYYSEDRSIPMHIHEMFKKGLPADFRLIGATTRSPEDLPPALRSRCVEIYFRPLTYDELIKIGEKAVIKGSFKIEDGVLPLIAKYSENGRDVVNLIQIAGSVAILENRSRISRKDVEWVIEFGRYTPKFDKKVTAGSCVGKVNGLAVFGAHGTVMDIEATAQPSLSGTLTVTGIVEEEEIENRGQKLKKVSSARASVENMLTVLSRFCDIDYKKYDIHINFPCSSPVDGPSAGIAIVCAVFSAITGSPIDGEIAMTGELSIFGDIMPVGGVATKVAAAEKAGVRKVLIPRDNYQELFENSSLNVVCVDRIDQVFALIFDGFEKKNIHTISNMPDSEIMTAKGV